MATMTRKAVGIGTAIVAIALLCTAAGFLAGSLVGTRDRYQALFVEEREQLVNVLKEHHYGSRLTIRSTSKGRACLEGIVADEETLKHLRSAVKERFGSHLLEMRVDAVEVETPQS